MALKLGPQCCCAECDIDDMRLPECAENFWTRDILITQVSGFPSVDLGIYTFCGVFSFELDGYPACGFEWLSPTTKDKCGVILKDTGAVTEPQFSLTFFATGPRACGEAGGTHVGSGSLGADTASTAFTDFACDEVPLSIIGGGFFGNYEATLLI